VLPHVRDSGARSSWPQDDRPRPPGRDGELYGRRTASPGTSRDGRADARALRRGRPALPVAAGGGRTCERARDPRGAGGGTSLMFNGHMDTSYLRPGAVAPGVPGFQPEAFVRDDVSTVSDLEHEGRARLLRRGAPGAARRRRGCGATCWSRRSAGRSRRRSRGKGRCRVPRLRGRHAVSRLARRRGRHVPPRGADRGKGGARPLRRALAQDPGTETSSTRRSARDGATRTRSCASSICSRP
jgi:hypothetical protein